MSHHRSLKGNCLRVVKAQAVLNVKFGTAVHKAGKNMTMTAAQVSNTGNRNHHVKSFPVDWVLVALAKRQT